MTGAAFCRSVAIRRCNGPCKSASTFGSALLDSIMKRKRTLLAFVVVLAAAVPCAVWVILSQPDITRINYGRIEHGMNLEEVETILGSPGAYQPIGDPARGGGPGFWWQGDDLSIIIALDNDHRVSGKYCEELPSLSFRSRVRRLLRI
jgi:hypothetical protein